MSWHNLSYSQYVIMLQGSMEIETGDGAKRIFHEGDILLTEDTTGQGHITRSASEGDLENISPFHWKQTGNRIKHLYYT